MAQFLRPWAFPSPLVQPARCLRGCQLAPVPPAFPTKNVEVAPIYTGQVCGLEVVSPVFGERVNIMSRKPGARKQRRVQVFFV